MDIKLPKLGEGADSGTVVNILVQEGDQVEEGQTIIELENEKAVAPIPASGAGKVKTIKVKEGDRLSVGQVILSLEGGDGADEKDKSADDGEDEESKKEKKSQDKSKSRPSRKKKPARDEEGEDGEEPEADEASEEEEPEGDDEESDAEPVAPPSIRRVARQLGISLGRVRGTESGGRIGWADLRAYVQRLQKAAARAGRPAAQGEGEEGGAPEKAAAKSIDFSQWGPVSTRAMSPIRQTISDRMAENWSTIPHVTQFDEVDITDLNALRKKFSGEYESKGSKLTLTPFVLKAVAETLRKHPIFNASLDEAKREIVYKDYVHVGLAVDTEHGLMVPVIRDVDRKSLLELSRDVNTLAEKARDRKVSLDEMKGGTFTISNQGGIGGAHFTPIVNKPEAAILGLGRGAMKPAVRDGQVVARLLMPIGLSYDHRLIDGGTAARFTVDLVEALQSFQESDVALGS